MAKVTSIVRREVLPAGRDLWRKTRSRGAEAVRKARSRSLSAPARAARRGSEPVEAGGESAGYYLRLDRPSLADELRRATLGELRSAAAIMRSPTATKPSSIHRVRKHIKKARSALRLGRGELSAPVVRDLNAQLRTVNQRLSATRDADVLVATAKGLAKRARTDEERRAAEVAVTRLSAAAEEARAQHRLTPAEVAQVAATLDRVADLITGLEVKLEGWEAIDLGFRRQYRRGRQALASLGASPDDEALHDLRKRSKDLWYHQRLLRDLWPAAQTPLREAADRLADVLGDDQDLANMTLVLDRYDDDGALAPLRPLLAEARAELQAQARVAADHLFVDPATGWTERHRGWYRAGQPPD